MIIISDKPFDISEIIKDYPEKSIERNILEKMNKSSEKYEYNSLNQLKFELRLRSETIKAANELNNSDMSFRVFRKSKANPVYWNRLENGGFELKDGVKPSEAINDIFKNGSKYGTECATAMVIVFYKAILNIFSDELFNKQFPKINLMNWHSIDPLLREIGIIKDIKDFLPGDRGYFDNPDVDPKTPEWQGENVIIIDDDKYYGHGIGKHTAKEIIEKLNRRRIKDSTKSAKLLNSVSRPNYKNLADIYNKAI